MTAYRFVGSACSIHGVGDFSKFGQRVELPETVADTVILGGGAFIPEAQFEALGFTAEELKSFPFPGQQANAPESFQNKKREAILAFQTRNEELRAARFRGEN